MAAAAAAAGRGATEPVSVPPSRAWGRGTTPVDLRSIVECRSVRPSLRVTEEPRADPPSDPASGLPSGLASDPPSELASDPASTPSRWARAWPHVRALLIAIHIVAVVVLAIPDAGGVALSRKSWKNPTVQAELKAWAQRLSALGLQTDAATLEQDVFEIARSWTEGLAWLRAPVRPYAEYLGVRQTWRMFVAPHRHPAKFQVDVEQDGQWRPVQVARSDQYGWRSHQLDHVRVRSLLFRYGWKRYRRFYRAFAEWIADRAAEDFPAAQRVRVRMVGFRTPTPQEVQSDAIPEGEFRQTIVLPLEERR